MGARSVSRIAETAEAAEMAAAATSRKRGGFAEPAERIPHNGRDRGAFPEAWVPPTSESAKPRDNRDALSRREILFEISGLEALPVCE